MRHIRTQWDMEGRIAMTVGPFILTNRAFDKLPDPEQQAILAHERGHIHAGHAWRRLWWIVSLQWEDLAAKCQRQEYEADRHAVKLGHGHGLLQFLDRVGDHESVFHPPHRLRVLAILGEMEKFHRAPQFPTSGR